MHLTAKAPLSFCLLLILVSPFSAFAVKLCYDCHDKTQFEGTIIHKPVAEVHCTACHDPHVARHQNLLRDREDHLCFTCHEDSKNIFAKGTVHSPVARGTCTPCHKPHASSRKGLIQENLVDACLGCHEDLKKAYKQTHKPYGEGNCSACHLPHQADNQQLLNDEPDKLCFSCHALSSIQPSHPNYPGKVRNCLSCHNPHGSEKIALIRDFLHKPYTEGCTSCHQGSKPVSTSTCLGCHEHTGQQMLANHNHLTLQNGNSCLNCHSPHAGNDKDLLKAREEQICFSCHAETLLNYKQKKSKHPPIKKCSTCHESHGSTNLSMLKGGGNQVCIQCHETQGNFTHPVGPEVLDTHTGQIITCVSCHNPMGTEHKFHLVQEGKRALCVLCHRTY